MKSTIQKSYAFTTKQTEKRESDRVGKANQDDDKRPSRNVRPFYPPPSADLDTPWTINVYSASHDPQRWERYNRVANQSYTKRGLQAVGEELHIDINRYPTYFAEGFLSDDNSSIGGIRIHLPDASSQVPLVEELEGYMDTVYLKIALEKLSNEGISHGGGLWIDPMYARSGLAEDLARASIPMFISAGVRWSVATGHSRILEAWASLGWHRMPGSPTFPFPDQRYQTQILLCDHAAWPEDICEWATKQCNGVTLDGPDIRFTVQPMRTEADAERAIEW